MDTNRPTDMDTKRHTDLDTPTVQSLPTDMAKSRQTDLDKRPRNCRSWRCKRPPTDMDTTTAQPFSSLPTDMDTNRPTDMDTTTQPFSQSLQTDRDKSRQLNQDKKSQVSSAPQSSVPSAPLSSVPPVRADDEWPQDGDEIPLGVCLSLYHHHITRLQKELESQKKKLKKLKSQKKLHVKEKKHAQEQLQYAQEALKELRDDIGAIKGVTTGTEGTTWWGRGVDKDDNDDNDDNHNYVYHLNVHDMDTDCLKAILDYDYEDVHTDVLVKYGVVTNAQSHKTNVSQTLKNGFIMFELNSVPSQSIDSIQCIDGTVHRYAPGPSDEWEHHWMILPKHPYAYE